MGGSKAGLEKGGGEKSSLGMKERDFIFEARK